MLSPEGLKGSFSAAILFLSCTTLNAQLLPGSPQQDHQRALRSNAIKLKVTLALDRKEYLPGETGQVTITLANPTSGPLDVYQPFRSATGLIQAFPTETVGGVTVVTGGDQTCCRIIPDETPTYVMASGESMSGTFDSRGKHFDSSEPLAFVPFEPGEYRLVYTHGAGNTDFKVAQATIEAFVSVPFQKPGKEISNGKAYDLPRRAMLVVLRTGTAHYVIVTVRDVFGADFDYRSKLIIGKNLDFAMAREIAPYQRIATSTQPIVAVQGTADAQENITVTWASADGQKGTVYVGSDRRPLQ